MMKKKRLWLMVFLLGSWPLLPCSHSGVADLTVEQVVKKLDELYRSTSSYAEVEMKVITPNWERTMKMKVWTEGMKKTFIRITSPAKEEGVATLRLGNEMWNYLPKTNKVMKIPPSMMMSSWMGSDFTNDDLVSEFSYINDYLYRFVTPEDATTDLLYIEFKPKEGLPIVWGSIVSAVNPADYIPVWEKYYDEKGQLMRIFNFREVQLFDGRKIPSVMEVIPQNKEGNKTVLRYLEAKFNLNIPNEIFSLRNLQTLELK